MIWTGLQQEHRQVINGNRVSLVDSLMHFIELDDSREHSGIMRVQICGLKVKTRVILAEYIACTYESLFSCTSRRISFSAAASSGCERPELARAPTR